MVFNKKKLSRAFSLIELLVVIALVVILAALLLPALSRARSHGASMACANNSKQLDLAWRLYADDNGGKLVNNGLYNGWTVYSPPQTGKRIETPNWVYGLLDWSASPDNTNTHLLAKGLLFPYAPQVTIAKCPADRYLSSAQVDEGFGQRVRSVALNSYLAGSAEPNEYLAPGFAIYVKETDLIAPTPSDLWVFADENPDTINDGFFRTQMLDTNDWADVPGSYHDGACVFSFADAHVEIHKWKSGRTCPPVHFGETQIEDPGSQDISWVHNHTTAALPAPGRGPELVGPPRGRPDGP